MNRWIIPTALLCMPMFSSYASGDDAAKTQKGTAATATTQMEQPPLIPREVLFGNPERVSV